MPDPPPPSNRTLALTTRVVVIVVLLLIGAGIFTTLVKTKPVIEQTDPSAARRSVQVYAAQRVEVQRQWRGYGTAQALDTADVPARVTATVKRIPDPIKPGHTVSRGELLIQLDDDDFNRNLDIAQQRIAEIDAGLQQLAVEEKRLKERLALEDSDVAVAQTDYDRQLRMAERNVANTQDIDAAKRTLIAAKRSQLQTQQSADLIGPRRASLEAQKASQQSQVNLADLNRQRTTITSPIDGVIQSIDVEEGESVAANARVARVVSLDRIEVPVRLPATSRLGVKVGDLITLRPTWSVGQHVEWCAPTSRIAPEEDPQTRTITAYVELTRSESQPFLPAPGMFLEATVDSQLLEARWVVPRRAIRDERIQLVRDETLVSRPVTVDYYLSAKQPASGLPDDQWAVLMDALEPGDMVVVNAATHIADGTRVDPTVMGDPAQAHDAADGQASLPGADLPDEAGGTHP